MSTVRLFSEAVDHDVEYITEEKEGGGKNYKIRGIFMQADIKNRTGCQLVWCAVDLDGRRQDYVRLFSAGQRCFQFSEIFQHLARVGND